MKSFTEAYDYIKYTSPKDIATRTAIFGAFFNMYMYKNFGHDAILDIVAALYGPFDYGILKDKRILEMLDTIHYGFNRKWGSLLWEWANANAASPKEFQAFDDMMHVLEDGKCDEILEYFNYICKVVQPSNIEYFPEMEVFSGLYDIKKWPRI